MKILLKISYLGTDYCGYQVQKNAISIQERLQDAVCGVFGHRYPVTGCSRTDSGVHANEFYCTVDTDENANSVPLDRVPAAMNNLLPDDIAVYTAEAKSEDFHPRYSAKSKQYRYVIWNGRQKNPFMNNRAYHYAKPLDAEKMSKAAEKFIGEHDFRGFMSSGSSVESTVRTIYDASVVREGDCVIFTVSGNGFLYNMVRIIVGTLIAVSEGKIPLDEIDEIIASCDRSRAGMTAPACGLYLNRVTY